MTVTAELLYHRYIYFKVSKKRGSDIGTLKDQSCMSACSSIEKKHKTDDPFDLLWLLMQESEKQILKSAGTEPIQIKLTHRK